MRRTVVGVACLAVLTAVVAPACSQGEGTGACAGTLNAPNCWSGEFDLHPDFFAAIPGTVLQAPGFSTPSMQIRVQHGGDNETFSDGVLFLIDDAGEIRGDPADGGAERPSLLGVPLVVGLPVGVVTPGVPVTPVASPSIVHATLYLDYTCRTQNNALYALDQVSGVGPDGECVGGLTTPVCSGSPPGSGADAGTDAASSSDASIDAAPSTDAGVDGGAASSPPGGIGTSTITFTSLFDNNPDETNASLRLSQASFDLYLADPRNICPGGFGPPPQCEGHIKGNFRFYFQRGRPAQPFP